MNQKLHPIRGMYFFVLFILLMMSKVGSIYHGQRRSGTACHPACLQQSSYKGAQRGAGPGAPSPQLKQIFVKVCRKKIVVAGEVGAVFLSELFSSHNTTNNFKVRGATNLRGEYFAFVAYVARN